MSEINSNTCQCAAKLELAAKECLEKAGRNWDSPTADGYSQAALEIRRVSHRHFSQCTACQREEDAREAAALAVDGYGGADDRGLTGAVLRMGHDRATEVRG